MRSLSASLTAAQKAASNVPYVEAKVYERIADVPRLNWTSQWTDGAAPDDEHDAIADADYLHRARVNSNNAQYERDPGAGWATLSSASDVNRVAISAVNDTRVIVVYNRGTVLYFRESTDQGGTFGSETLILNAGAAPAALAVAYKNNTGDLAIVWESGTDLKRIRRTSGAFGSPATWTNSMNSINGVDVEHYGDFHIVITGTDTSDRPVVLQCILGDGFSVALDTWTALQEIALAENGSNVTFRAPFLAVLDTHRLTFVEKYTGSTAYARLMSSWIPPSMSFAANGWREPIPFDLSQDEGAAITGAGTTAHLSRPDEHWTALFDEGTADLTADVLELDMKLRPHEGRVKLTLRNDDGRFNDLPNGSYPQITHGAQLDISPGYTTSSGNEHSHGPKFWITHWEHTTAAGRATLVIYATNAWSYLRRWRARRQYSWASGTSTISLLLGFAMGRSGIDLGDTGASTAAVTLRPEFTIQPGHDGLQVTQRLLAMLPDVILMAGERASIFEPDAADATDYAYGTDHGIFAGRYATAPLAANRIQIYGDGELAEEFDWPDITDQLPNLHQVFDLNIDTAAKAADRADFVLRQHELAIPLGQIITPPNVGQEIYDVIEVTDTAADLNAEKFRVAAIDLHYRRERQPTYEQRLLLTNP